MIDLALSFLPWVVFTSVNHLTSFTGAIVLAIVASVAVVAVAKVRGRIHLLDVASLAYFGVLLAVVAVVRPSDLGTWNEYTQPGSYAALAAITFATIAIRRPFTISYAKESTPEELWDTDVFLQINTRISAAWGSAFVVGAISSAIAVNTTVVPFVFHALPYVALYLAYRYTQKASGGHDRGDARVTPTPVEG